MTAPVVRPESATLPTNALGYVDIVNFRPPVGALVPDRNDPDVQVLLARTNQRRAPDCPLRVCATDGGFVLADAESYRAWWALRRAGSGIGVLKPELVELVEDETTETPTAAEPDRPTVTIAPRSTSPVRIALDALTVDPGLQTRAAMNDVTVAEYAEALLAGEVLPPVVVFRDGEGMWLADGFHRVAAARHAGLPDVDAIVHDGGRREALLHAVGANARHGLRRTNADKRRAVEMLLADNEWGARSDNWIAEKCGVSHPFVGSVRASTCNGYKCPTRETANGRVMETANIGRTWATPPARAAVSDSQGPEIDFPTGPGAPDGGRPDGAAVQTQVEEPADEDVEHAPDAVLVGDLDVAGATVVRLLAALAVDRPVDARTFAKRHRAAVAAATNPRR